MLDEVLRDPEVAGLLTNPTVETRVQRQRFLDPLASRLHSKLVRNTIGLLIDRRRAEVLRKLPSMFHRLALEARGEAGGVVESARPSLPRRCARSRSRSRRRSPARCGSLRRPIRSSSAACAPPWEANDSTPRSVLASPRSASGCSRRGFPPDAATPRARPIRTQLSFPPRIPINRHPANPNEVTSNG